MKRVYPVIFTMTKDKKDTVLIEVPDLEILTEGYGIENAVDMARDAIGLKGITLQDKGMEIPEASLLGQLDYNTGTFAGEGESFASIIDVDFSEYRRKVDNKSVRRNVTIPNWLNVEAEKAGINVSKILQNALIEVLGVQKSL